MTSPLNISTIRKVKIPQGIAAWTSMTLRRDASVTRRPAAARTSIGITSQRTAITPQETGASAARRKSLMISWR